MRKAIGLLIILWGFSQFFTNAFTAFDQAATGTFRAIETAALVSESNLAKQLQP